MVYNLKMSSWKSIVTGVGLFLLAGTVSALINLKFTPIDLARQSEAIVHVSLSLSDDGSSVDLRTVDVLKGEDPGIRSISIPYHLRAELEEIKDSSGMPSVLLSGGFGGTNQVLSMLKTDAGWYGLYGEKEQLTLGEDPFDLRAVWAGSAKMLVSAFNYILADPGRAKMPVTVGVKWDRIVKQDDGMKDVKALVPLLDSGGNRLFLAASTEGDRLYDVDGLCRITDVTADMSLSSSSALAAWCDMNADGTFDLLSWSGKNYELHSRSDSGFRKHGEAPWQQAVYSLSCFIAAQGHAGIVVAGTEAGPQIVSVSDEGGSLSVKAVAASSSGGGPCAVADFTGDGRIDIAEITKTHILLYQGAQNGQFMMPVKSAETYGLSFLLKPLVCDFDHDGRLDILAAGSDGAEPYMNLGGGRFENIMPVSGELSYVGKPNVIGASSADFNNDGRQEFILFYEEQGPLPFFNRGFACFGYAKELELRESGLPMSDTVMRGQIAGLTADMDADGNQETIIVTSSGELLLLETTARQPLLALETVAYGKSVSPRSVNGAARFQLMGARNTHAAFPAFWGVRHKGPVDLTYKDEAASQSHVRKIVLKPAIIRIGPPK